MNPTTNTTNLAEAQILFIKAWTGVLRNTLTLRPTCDPTFPGFYCETDDVGVGIAVSGKHYIVGHMDRGKQFIPNAGPFDSPSGAVIAAIGMVANFQASRILQGGD